MTGAFTLGISHENLACSSITRQNRLSLDGYFSNFKSIHPKVKKRSRILQKSEIGRAKDSIMANEEAIRAELAEIRAAIILSQHSAEEEGEEVTWKSPLSQQHDSGSSDTSSLSTADSSITFSATMISSTDAVEEFSASYDEGATPLFRAIESRDWAEAMQLITPTSAATWVVRTPEQETVFAWTHWKRLPFHEALRCSAAGSSTTAASIPFLHALLDAYPAAMEARTNHGATPLHVACDSGAPATTLSWLIARCPGNTIVTDHSGRTALEVLHDTAVLYPEEQAIAVQVLECASDAVEEQLQRAQVELQEAREEQEELVFTLRKEHANAMQEAQAKRVELEHEVDRLHDVLQDQTGMWRDRWQAAQDQIVTLKMESRRLQRELKRSGALKDRSDTKVVAGRLVHRQREVAPQLHAAQTQLAEAAQALLTIQDVLSNELDVDEQFDLTLQEPLSPSTTAATEIAEDDSLEFALLSNASSHDP